jgi:hypothetical protein
MFLITLLAAAAAGSAAAAQGTPQASGLAELGLPEMAVTVTDTAIEGIPGELPAGRYLLTVTSDVDAGGAVELARPEHGATDAFIAAYPMLHASHAHDAATEPAGGHDDHGEMAMTPTAAHGDSHDAAGMDLSVIYSATFAGGATAWPDRPAQVVLDLPPGEWVATGGSGGTQAPVIFTVTGEMPADLPEPRAGATITMGEYVIKVTDGALVPGRQVIRVDNIGVQPHLVTAGVTQAAVNTDEIVALEQPGAAGAASLGLTPGFATTSQSRGASMWVVADLTSGSWVLLCHFPDLGDGRAHSAHGMVDVITIDD